MMSFRFIQIWIPCCRQYIWR